MLLADGLLYMVDDGGKMSCFEADSGKVVWQSAQDGNFSSSPVLAGGHIYVVNEAGVTFVLKPGRTFELVAKNDLGDGGFATPVICGSRVYLRTLHALYCLGEQGPRCEMDSCCGLFAATICSSEDASLAVATS